MALAVKLQDASSTTAVKLYPVAGVAVATTIVYLYSVADPSTVKLYDPSVASTGASNYNVSAGFTASASTGFVASTQLAAVAAETHTAAVAQTAGTTLALSASQTMAATAGWVDSASPSLAGALSLSSAVVWSASAQLAAVDALALSSTAAWVSSGPVVRSVAMALSSTVGWSPSSRLALSTSLSLSSSVGWQAGSQAAYVGSLGLASSVTFTDVGSLAGNYSHSMALSASVGWAASSSLAAVADATHNGASVGFVSGGSVPQAASLSLASVVVWAASATVDHAAPSVIPSLGRYRAGPVAEVTRYLTVSVTERYRYRAAPTREVTTYSPSAPTAMPYPGSVVHVPIAITDTVTGVAVDPTTLVVEVRAPSGVETVYTYSVGVEVVRDSAGNYHIDVAVPYANTSAAVGKWYVAWRGTGAGAGSGQASFTVSRLGVTPGA